MAKTTKAPQHILTPSPKELQKALAQSAKQAEALAAAYGVKVPYARATVARTAPAPGKLE